MVILWLFWSFKL